MEERSQKIETICVFFGSSPGKDQEYMKVANNLGNLLAARNIKLVYGGANSGLMGCVARSTYSSKGRVVGIIPQIIAERNYKGICLGDEFKVPSMHEKIVTMLHNTDAFIALPGGLGTLEEIFCITSWAQLNLHQKPVGLLNINGFYNRLMAFLDHCVEQEFINPVTSRILISAPNAEQLLDLLQASVRESDPFLTRMKWETKNEGSGRNNDRHEPDTTLQL